MALKLPLEILLMITSFLDIETLKSLRLTSRDICTPATKSLFQSVVLFNRHDSCNAVESIMTHPQLKEHVQKVYLMTVEFDFVSFISLCAKKQKQKTRQKPITSYPRWFIG